MAQVTLLKSLKPLGFQAISSTSTPVTAVNSTCRAADVLSVSVTGQAARYRADAAPTRTTGVYLAANSHTWFERYHFTNTTTNLRFVGAVTTSAAIISIQAWQYNQES